MFVFPFSIDTSVSDQLTPSRPTPPGLCTGIAEPESHLLCRSSGRTALEPWSHLLPSHVCLDLVGILVRVPT